METSRTMAVNLEIVDSVRTIELDAEGESIRATYDSTRDSTSFAVVAVVTTVLGKDPRAVTPLQSAIDTDALDRVSSESSTGFGNCDSISFSYEGLEVTVTGDGVIEADPIEDA
ncbi:HalOD1 output domain-containing protein [Halosimplex amylolyticum]|uniref:HalOD1 output domain-containing protein n=1 Tax=Halosimplex amylolyticum TaxID=3396616 RepID=UPI003F564789